MEYKGIYVCHGMKHPRQFFFEGSGDLIEYFLSRSPYSSFESDISILKNRYIEITDQKVYEFLVSHDGGFSGNCYPYVFHATLKVSGSQSIYTSSSLSHFDEMVLAYEGKRYLFSSDVSK